MGVDHTHEEVLATNSDDDYMLNSIYWCLHLQVAEQYLVPSLEMLQLFRAEGEFDPLQWLLPMEAWAANQVAFMEDCEDDMDI